MELFSDRCYFFIITSARKTLLWTAHRIKKKRQYICNSINTLFLGWCHGFTMFILCDTMMKHLPPVLVAPAWFLIKPRRSAALAVFTVEIDSGLFVYQKRKKKGKKRSYQILQYAQRTHTQSVLPGRACEATPRWRQSVSPTRNDHLSLVQINGDDGWGGLAVLTAALRRGWVGVWGSWVESPRLWCVVPTQRAKFSDVDLASEVGLIRLGTIQKSFRLNSEYSKWILV